MSKTEIILIGAGGHAKSCIDVIEQQDKFKIAGLIGKKEELGRKVCGYSIFGIDNDLPELFKLNTILEIAEKDEDQNFKRLCFEYFFPFPVSLFTTLNSA